MPRVKKIIHFVTSWLLAAGCAAMLAAFSVPAVAAVDPAQAPLYLTQSVAPNIMFVLDDSGSMQFEYMPSNDVTNAFLFSYLYPVPDTTYSSDPGDHYYDYLPTFEDELPNFYLRSHANNKIYYDPNITYKPWSNADGTLQADANPNKAYFNPERQGAGSVDLLAENTKKRIFWRCCDANDAWQGNKFNIYYKKETESFWPVVYWIYTGPTGGDHLSRTNYKKVEVTNSGIKITRPDGTTKIITSLVSPDGKTTRTRTEIAQNFANWFQYYRSRVLLARAGIGRSFASLGKDVRVGFDAINNGGGDMVLDVRRFSGAERKNFFSTLYNWNIPHEGTPLRRALYDVGEYYTDGSDGGPWSTTPGVNNSKSQYVCRQSYTILMTDGYWSGGSPRVDNVDGSDGSQINGPTGQSYQYEPTRPYKDNYDNTLADVAQYYWERDLRPNLENSVTPNSKDPAFWQHMVTFTVGLGVTGNLTNNDLAALTSGTKSWPDIDPSVDDARKIDDLFHASINGHGGFFSAADPPAFATALTDALSSIASRVSSAASIATNSTRLDTTSAIYQAKFNSGDWSGQLVAYQINSDGSVGAPKWTTNNSMANVASSSRKIFTWQPSTGDGVSFEWANLSAGQQGELGHVYDNGIWDSTTDAAGEARLKWLRGNRQQEKKNGGNYRDRIHLLGDIVNSDPVYTAYQDYLYYLLPSSAGTEQTSYETTFRDGSAYKSRTPVVYAGANDGMLHAFDADNGNELFAYVPNAVFPNLSRLPNPTYDDHHHYFVDGSVHTGDAWFNSEWHTVLVGSLGGGGKGVYALDVTSPASFGASDVLWEYDADTSGNDPDLGYTYGTPTVVRLNDGYWYAMFANGYGSANGSATLYLIRLDATDFNNVIKIVVSAKGSSCAENGLSTPIPVDANGDRITDSAYAGDLCGNLWKFDLKANNLAKNSASLLFQARDKNNRIQPITERPEVGSSYGGSGYMVYFGTGQYFEVGDSDVDAATDPINSFYAILDQGSQVSRADLVQQEILAEVGKGAETARVVSNNVDAAKYDVDYKAGDKGWYLNLVSPVNGFEGERVVSRPLLRDGRIIFTTLIPTPTGNPCLYGGTGWLMELNAKTGERFDHSVLDIDGDGDFDDDDKVTFTREDGSTATVSTSGLKSKIGIIQTPGIIGAGQKEYKYVSGSSGAIGVVEEKDSSGSGRQSWRTLQ